MVHKIISGGQTGPDRAALDFALKMGYPCGGWCPKGRLAEDGKIPLRYPLKETITAKYSERTIKNVKEADGTIVILLNDEVDTGTELTIQTCKNINSPYLKVMLHQNMKALAKTVDSWVMENDIKVLNIAGPRESNALGIQEKAYTFLITLADYIFSNPDDGGASPM